MINEKIEYVEYKFRNKNDAMNKNILLNEFMDDDINNGTLVCKRYD